MKNSTCRKLTLGIDIGGTNAAFGIVDKEGTILCRGNITVSGHESFEHFIMALRLEVEQVAATAGIRYDEIADIGAGAPCLNRNSGIIEGAVNLPWASPLPLTQELNRVFGLPAYGENDANVAALGELHFGAGKGIDNFIMITLGTGVGGAVICDGRLLYGKRGLAGELGHIPVIHGPEARVCSCGRRGCADAYVSARGIITTARQLIENTDIPSRLRERADLDAATVGKYASAGDPLALETFRLSGEIIGKACADFTAFSSPEAFIFFGGVSKSFPFFKESMLKAYDTNLLWIYDGQVQFMQAALPEGDAALLGAVAAARERCNDKTYPTT